MTVIGKKHRGPLGYAVNQGAPLRRISVPALEPMTYKEFLETDFEDPHVEWVDGRAVAMSPINEEHQRLSVWLVAVLATFVDERKLGVVLSEPYQMKLGGKLPGRAPDVLYVSHAHKKRRKKAHLDGPADLVVEIISPGSRGRDRGEKFYEYEAGRVPEYWVIDPPRKQAEFYMLNRRGMYEPAALDAGVFHSQAIPGVWMRPEWFWATPFPTPFSIVRQWGLK
jgi:Uma2 family endonuclease